MALGSLGTVPASTATMAWLETGARSRVQLSGGIGRHWSSTCTAYAHPKFGLLQFPSRSSSVAVYTKRGPLCFQREDPMLRVSSQEKIGKQFRGQRQLTCAKTKQLLAPACPAKGTPEKDVLTGSSNHKPSSAEVEKFLSRLELEEERPLAGRKSSAEKVEVSRLGGRGASKEGSGRTWSNRSNGAASSTPDAEKDEVQSEAVALIGTRPPQVKASEGSGVAGTGHTLLERGTRLINTTPKDSRWRDARPKTDLPDAEGIASSGSPVPGSSAPPSSLDAIFGYSEPGRGRQRLRFTRNPQPDVNAGSADKQEVDMLLRSSALSALPRGRFDKNGVRLRRSPSSGLLAGYETVDETGTTESSPFPGAGSEWVVETCPVCHGTATLVCDVCDSGWPPGSCPECKGVGYKACSHCHGSGTTYGRAKGVQPSNRTFPSKAPVQTTSVGNGPLEEEGPSLLEAYRIIKKERQIRGASNGAPGKAHWAVGRPKSEEHRAKISRALQGKPRAPLSSSHRKKLSDLRREFFEMPGARERWSELSKKYWAPRKRVMHCSHCGLEGHNSRFCPELGFVKSANKPCPICGQAGHSRGGSCPKRGNVRIPFRCKKCGEYGHEAGQCPNSAPFPGRTLCEICGLPDHRVRECPGRPKELIIQRCRICGQPGHNRKRCPQRMGRTLCEICGLPDHCVRECPVRLKELIIHRCSICGQPGHNRKRCPQRTDTG